MSRELASELGIDLDDPDVQANLEAINRDHDLIRSLVETRQRLGLRQADIAKRMGRSQATVSDFERLGGDPHLSTVRRYARALGGKVVHTFVTEGDGKGSRSIRFGVTPVDARSGRTYFPQSRAQ